MLPATVFRGSGSYFNTSSWIVHGKIYDEV